MRKTGDKCINASKASEEAWADGVQKIANSSLLPSARSWYMGDNIPGKLREQLNFAGGFPLYSEMTRSVLDKGFEGFVTA